MAEFVKDRPGRERRPSTYARAANSAGLTVYGTATLNTQLALGVNSYGRRASQLASFPTMSGDNIVASAAQAVDTLDATREHVAATRLFIHCA